MSTISSLVGGEMWFEYHILFNAVPRRFNIKSSLFTFKDEVETSFTKRFDKTISTLEGLKTMKLKNCLWRKQFRYKSNI